MNLLHNLVLIVHFVGLAALLGGFLVQISAPKRGELRIVNQSMRDGAITQLVTGVLLVGLAYPLNDQDPTEALPDNAKITVKLLVALVIVAVVLLGRRKPAEAQQPYWAITGILALVNVCVAVLW